MRCVIDTNIYLSFLLKPFKAESPPTRVVQLISDGSFDLIFPIETAAELRLKVRNKASLGAAIKESALEELIETLNVASISVEFRQFDHVEVPDPKDMYLLDAAISGCADFLITGDKPLQQMTSPPKGTSIVAPAEFRMILEALRGQAW
jgi:putative PIN family toxin of toxin-antitoxin system